MLDYIVNNNFLFPLIVSVIICVCYYIYNEKYSTYENKPLNSTYIKLFVSIFSILIGVSYFTGSEGETNFDLLGGSNLSNILPNFSNNKTQETLENTNNDVEKSNPSDTVITSKIVNTLNNNIKEPNTNTNVRNEDDFFKTTNFTTPKNQPKELNNEDTRNILSPNSTKRIEKFLTGNPEF